MLLVTVLHGVGAVLASVGIALCWLNFAWGQDSVQKVELEEEYCNSTSTRAAISNSSLHVNATLCEQTIKNAVLSLNFVSYFYVGALVPMACLVAACTWTACAAYRGYPVKEEMQASARRVSRRISVSSINSGEGIVRRRSSGRASVTSNEGGASQLSQASASAEQSQQATPTFQAPTLLTDGPVDGKQSASSAQELDAASRV